MPTRCCMRTASAIADMRTRAIGLSPMLMASAPAALSMAAPSSALRGLRPRGGSSSTQTTNSPAASFSRRVRGFVRDVASRRARSTPTAIVHGDARRRRRRLRAAAAVPFALEHLAHGGGVLGRGAAAAADDAGAGLDELAGVVGEVLGRRGVDEAVVDVLREAGVRHGGEADRRRGRHALDDFERVVRAEAAVDAGDIGAERGGDVRDFVRRLAAERAVVALEGALGDDRAGRRRTSRRGSPRAARRGRGRSRG